MNTGIIVRDPTRTFNMIWNPPISTWFSCSNYLINRRKLLVKKFYKRKLIINNITVFGLTVLVSVAFLIGMIYLLYISGLYLIPYIGIPLALGTIYLGMIIFYLLSDKFPLDTIFIHIENRKKKK